MSKKRGRGEGPSAEKIAEDQLRWATFFAAENDNVLDAYSLEPLDPTVNNNAHAVHFCPVHFCPVPEGAGERVHGAQQGVATKGRGIEQGHKFVHRASTSNQWREKEDGKGKESRAGEPGAGAGDG